MTARKLTKPIEAHVYMTAADRTQLEDWARDECRSVNGQILHIIREALSTRQRSVVASLSISPTEQVRNATRRAAAEPRR